MINWEEIDRQLEEMETPPPGIVPLPLTAVLIEQTKPLRDIIIRYAYLVNGARKVFPIDTDELRNQYEPKLRLIAESVGVLSSCNGVGLLHALDEIDRALADIETDSERDVADILARHLYAAIQLTQEMPSLKDLEHDQESAEDRAEYERLKSDSSLLQTEIEHYTAQLKGGENE